MSENIIIKPVYSFKDYILPVKHILLKSWGVRIVIFIAFIMLFLDIYYFFDNSIFAKDIPTLNIALPLVVFLLTPVTLYFGLNRSFEKNYLIKEDTTVTYNKKGINTKGETYEVFTEWSKIKTIKTYNKYFYFINVNGLKSTLHKDFFNETELNDFIALIKNKGFNL